MPAHHRFETIVDDQGFAWARDTSAAERWGGESSVRIPGASAGWLIEDLDALLGHSWRLACWLPRDAVVSFDEGGRWTGMRPLEPAAPPPSSPDVRIEKRGWDHDHCENLLCSASIDWGEAAADPRAVRPGEESSAHLGYTEGNDRWLCRGCGEALVRHGLHLIARLGELRGESR